MRSRIEICGNIASGKSTLAKAIAKNLCRDIALENFTAVPCLTDFYNDPVKFAFETENLFTLFHYYQLKKLDIGGVADFSLIDDYAFAMTTLSIEELNVYEASFDYILKAVGYADKVIYLKADITTLIERIKVRNRLNEKSISAEYLKNVSGNIEKSIEKKFSGTEIIVVNTDNVSVNMYTREFLQSIL